MLRVILWAIAGCVGGAAAAMAIGIAAGEVFDISQAEGAYAMGVAFFWTPLGGLVGAVAAGIWAALRR